MRAEHWSSIEEFMRNLNNVDLATEIDDYESQYRPVINSMREFQSNLKSTSKIKCEDKHDK